MADLIRGNYRQRSKYLSRLRNRYRGIAIKDQDTPEAKGLHKEILDLDTELKLINKSIGTTYNNSAYSNTDKRLK